MKILVIPTHMLATLAVIMTVCAPVLIPTTAEARRGVAACGPRGCGAAACGPRGCAAVGSTRPVVRPPVRRGVVVVAPRRYWRPGTAIAAGAAIGFVAGAAAVSLAGTPPQSGQCWYYTSPAKTTGFWDVCPR
ncbi:hypothetical protein [Rhizobium ruizarguesonis]|jgi:hypothetical protein|uniref:Transmembrane protein n=1 Tax=Rhizobium ruizarguesonis TaxID=2081791 RepID=A0AB38I0J8_9HYPH|nr:hypothetical protein [Rhizobium ruizarguesonis]NEI08411.1 hypothetical protein [Rhizobium ruizarguesonis]NEI30065.1 hypothetical protein [Rhizobium ruizarguesonis]TAY94467.1 hypothetical protein ELH85_15425 [Rhizobium ruizarguesonis]TAZ78872.1 hypothetical protein ELH68_14330 [Rhizobium ruizarguesonis]TBA05245.1 hypothetical protein ELH64_12830 [Rhizobium ruizarguesonis]